MRDNRTNIVKAWALRDLLCIKLKARDQLDSLPSVQHIARLMLQGWTTTQIAKSVLTPAIE